MYSPLTIGVHHVGLTTDKLEETADFFVSILGWQEVKRDDSYPSIFVSDGLMLITLWAAKSSAMNNRQDGIGLHHIALTVENEHMLQTIYQKLLDENVKIEFEFAPEFINEGPGKHMMCYEPSGIRIEFACSG